MDTHDFVMRRLMSQAGGVDQAHGQTCTCIDDHAMGQEYERITFLAITWFLFAVCIACLMYYAYHTTKSTCGWEEVYVCSIEVIKVLLDLFVESYSPCTITQTNGVRTMWLRYGEWLLCCPVILIHLSNLTGLKDAYSKRTMALLVSDLGCLVTGITAAFSTGPTKVVFFVVSCCYAVYTYLNAAKVYIEAYHSVPEGECKLLVKAMAWLYFLSWTAFPVLFVMGPEGVGYLSVYGSLIAHSVADFMSKNLWGLCGHELRIKVHEYIIMHGDIRKQTTINVAGETISIEEFVAEEDVQHGAVRRCSEVYMHRPSFRLMREHLKAQGKEVRLSLEGLHGDDAFDTESRFAEMHGSGPIGGHNGRTHRHSIVHSSGGIHDSNCGRAGFAGVNAVRGSGAGHGSCDRYGSNGSEQKRGSFQGGDVTVVMTTGLHEVCKKAAPSLQPGCVVLGVVDTQTASFFREQFAALPAITMIPAIGADAILRQIDNFAAFGGVDCVLLHPDYLRDQGPSSLLAHLRACKERICAFGWEQTGAVGVLIESAGLDGWLEGPSYTTGFDAASLQQLVQKMQERHQAAANVISPRAAAADNSSLLARTSPHLAATTRPVTTPTLTPIYTGGNNSPNTGPSPVMTSPRANNLLSSPRHPAITSPRATTSNPLFASTGDGVHSTPQQQQLAVAGDAADSDVRLLTTMIAQIERLRSHMALDKELR